MNDPEWCGIVLDEKARTWRCVDLNSWNSPASIELNSTHLKVTKVEKHWVRGLASTDTKKIPESVYILLHCRLRYTNTLLYYTVLYSIPYYSSPQLWWPGGEGHWATRAVGWCECVCAARLAQVGLCVHLHMRQSATRTSQAAWVSAHR